jgi:hypothetical protein
MLDSLVGQQFEVRQPSETFSRDFRVIAIEGNVVSIVDVDECTHRIRVWSLMRGLYQQTIRVSGTWGAPA